MRKKKVLAITGIRSEYDILYPIIKALQDQRIIPVNSESRINIVLADSRTILVPDETRILKEP
jgi:hypothetical protein